MTPQTLNRSCTCQYRPSRRTHLGEMSAHILEAEKHVAQLGRVKAMRTVPASPRTAFSTHTHTSNYGMHTLGRCCAASSPFSGNVRPKRQQYSPILARIKAVTGAQQPAPPKLSETLLHASPARG